MAYKGSTQSTWVQIKGLIRKEWGQLTDEDIILINGSREKLVELLMSKYNLSKKQSHKQVSRFWL
jgi:uncharacterized protein YjbJ (UPF0337 family)